MLLALLGVWCACKKDMPAEPSWDKLANSAAFEIGSVTGVLADDKLKELSGLAPSHAYPGLFWAHNDKGDQDADILYLIDSLGQRRAACTLKNINNRDWEDIAVGPGPIAGKTYVYLADIGDNDQSAVSVYVYRFEEPTYPNISNSYTTVQVNTVDQIGVVYPNNTRLDAETLLLDPLTLDLYIVSKGSEARVFKVPYPQANGVLISAQETNNWPLKNVTGGDIARSGTECLIRTNDDVYYWKKQSGQSTTEMFNTLPEKVSILTETNGEAICFNFWLSGFYTCGEQPGQLIHFYPKK